MAVENIDTATIEKRPADDAADDCEAGINSSNNDNNVTDTTKKMTKQGVESIKAAGNTLPTLVINKESHLIKKVAAPKKKVQSTLFPTANTNTSKQQAKATSTNPPAVQSQVGQDNQTKKRKAIDLKAKSGGYPVSYTAWNRVEYEQCWLGLSAQQEGQGWWEEEECFSWTAG